MFRREVKSISDLLNKYLRVEGLEVPLQQKRIIEQSKQLKSRKEMKRFVDNLKASG